MRETGGLCREKHHEYQSKKEMTGEKNIGEKSLRFLIPNFLGETSLKSTSQIKEKNDIGKNNVVTLNFVLPAQLLSCNIRCTCAFLNCHDGNKPSG